MRSLAGVGIAFGGALFWLMYFDLKDRLQPEPRRKLLYAFLLGMLGAGAAALAYELTILLGLPDHPDGSTASVFRYCMFLIGPIEELCKFVPAWFVVFRWKEFDEPVDGVIYAAALAIGFATLENLFSLAALPWPHQLARALTSPLTHSLLSAVWGAGVAKARFDPRSPLPPAVLVAGSLVAAMLLHGLYDFVIFAWGATYLAGGIAFVLWLGMIRHVRRTIAEARLRAPITP